MTPEAYKWVEEHISSQAVRRADWQPQGHTFAHNSMRMEQPDIGQKVTITYL